MARERILIVDDEPGVRTTLSAILEDEGFEVAAAETGERGVEAAGAGAFDAVLLDVWLPGIDGLETLSRLRTARCDAAVVMISGHGTIETAVRATKLGAFDFVEKPLSLEKTLLVLRNALRQRRLERRNRSLLRQLARDTEIVGESAAAEGLRRSIEAAASSEAPVTIRGERGSGRETIARRIHSAGPLAGEAFVPILSGALEAASGAAALFGEGKGEGRLALARGGCLFLEDAQLLDPGLQDRLAAALPDAGARVVASVGPDGAGLTSALAGAIDVVRIDVPPLRTRREDVEILAAHFMRDLAREYGKAEKPFRPEALARLRGHDWPGNVRELRNVVERLLLLSPGEAVEARDLPAEMGGARKAPDDLYREFGSLAEGVESFERYYVRRVWIATKGDLPAAAKRLGIEPSILAERLTALGIR